MLKCNTREAVRLADVLVVEDDRPVRQLVAGALRAVGYLVAAVDSGEAALVLLLHQRFDVALLDVNLPGIDGIELHREIGRLDRRLARRSLLMSGAPVSQDLQSYVDEHMAGFIAKPFAVAPLIELVTRVCASK